ncbi:RIP metalloprotease RseP [Thiolinea disciformis]|uniref:RIP metalloprotease RseP n=1 Tax=Thiolinea disciformis TaxID=125614 RepID=UPI000369FF15|nr:RIP metalloprotease RseP [Thiolinea disciformis]
MMNISNLLIILPAFLVTIGVLVAIHEFGHFWVARKLGVKVLRYSIGFGKPLWRRIGKDETEYVIAALPFGGYVKMLDEREGQVDPAERHLAFNTQSVWKRMAIVIAGPSANFLLAIFIYFMIFSVVGNPAMKPFVSAANNSPAALAGIKAGDRIVSVNQIPVDSWEDARMTLLEEYLKSPVLALGVETQQGSPAMRSLDLSGQALLKDQGDFLNKSGLEFWVPEKEVRLGETLPNSPAAQAGLKLGDIVLAVDGEKPSSAQAFVEMIQKSPNKTLELKLRRHEDTIQVNITPAKKVLDNQQEVGQIGAGVGETIPEATLKQLQFTQHYGPIDSIVQGFKKTWQMSLVTLKLMGRMFTGEVSLQNISGPITIAKFSGETAQAGLPYYLGFLAIVSISLGVLNLLPIPMLDGGHLLYYLIELVKGSPVSEKFEEFGLRFGMAVVAGVMVLALYNDFMRLLN